MSELLTKLDGFYSPWLPGSYVMPIVFLFIGFAYGLYRYLRSFPYLYHYYIKHGEVIWWTDNYSTELKDIAHENSLSKHFTPFGYVGGMLGCFLFSVAGTIIGTLWPLAAIIGVLTIPNFMLRYVARDKRAKAVFQQNLRGEKDGNS